MSQAERLRVMLAVFGGEPALDIHRALRQAAVPIDWRTDVELIDLPVDAGELSLLNACLTLEQQLRAEEYRRLAVALEAFAEAGSSTSGIARSLDGAGPISSDLAHRAVLALAELGWLRTIPEPRVPAGLVRRRAGQSMCDRRSRRAGPRSRRRRR